MRYNDLCVHDYKNAFKDANKGLRMKDSACMRGEVQVGHIFAKPKQ